MVELKRHYAWLRWKRAPVMASQLRAMVLVVVVVGALLFIVNTAIVNSQQSEVRFPLCRSIT